MEEVLLAGEELGVDGGEGVVGQGQPGQATAGEDLWRQVGQPVVGEVQLGQVLREHERLLVQTGYEVEAEIYLLHAGEVEDLLTRDGGDHVAGQVEGLDVPEAVGLAHHRGQSQVGHRAELRVGEVEGDQVGHGAEDPRLAQPHLVATEVQPGQVGQTLEGSPGEGEDTLCGGLDVETLEPGQAEEGSVRDLLEVAVDDGELLQPDQTPEAPGLELADGLGVRADDREGHGVVGGDDTEVGSLRVAVDGREVAGQLQGGVSAISEWF